MLDEKKDFQDYVNHHIKVKVLNTEQIILLNKFKPINILSFNILFKITSEQQKDLWYYIINNLWDKNNEGVCFNEQDSIMLREIIHNSGILSKKYLLNCQVLGTNHKIKKTAERLEELDYIFTIYIKGEIYYCFNFEIYNNCFNKK